MFDISCKTLFILEGRKSHVNKFVFFPLSAGDENQVSLAIVQASSIDSGVYGCTIANEYGTDSTDCLLSADSRSYFYLYFNRIHNFLCNIVTPVVSFITLSYCFSPAGNVHT